MRASHFGCRVDVERAMRDVLPEPIKSHFVVIGHRRYPPKQVIGELTALERAFFTSHHALRLLRNLGFAVGRQRPRHDAPVWFCEDWRPAFGLLGLTGFLDHFVVTVAAYEEWLELKPLDAEGPE